MATPKNQSVQKAFALLRSFRGAEEWVTNAELSRRTGLSEACAHRLMKTLEEIGAVVRDRRGCYRPGMVLATLSKDVAVGDLIRATSEDLLAGLAARLKGVVHVGVLSSAMVSYAAKFGEPVRVAVPSRVGAQQEAYCSALGKVLLAGMPAQQLEDFLYDGDFVALTPQTITTVASLQVRARRSAPSGLCRGQSRSFPDHRLRGSAHPRSSGQHYRGNFLCRCRQQSQPRLGGGSFRPSAFRRGRNQQENLPGL